MGPQGPPYSGRQLSYLQVCCLQVFMRQTWHWAFLIGTIQPSSECVSITSMENTGRNGQVKWPGAYLLSTTGLPRSSQEFGFTHAIFIHNRTNWTGVAGIPVTLALDIIPDFSTTNQDIWLQIKRSCGRCSTTQTGRQSLGTHLCGNFTWFPSLAICNRRLSGRWPPGVLFLWMWATLPLSRPCSRYGE
jgi:hypothetical protein